MVTKPYTAVVAALAAGVVLTACGESSEEASTDKEGRAAAGRPALGKPRLVDVTARGRSPVAVAVPVVHGGKRGSPERHRVEVTAKVRIRDRSGRTHSYAAQQDADSHRVLAGAGRRAAVHSHLFLSQSDARAVKRSIAQGGSATVEARAGVASDTRGDGSGGARSTLTSSQRFNKLVPLTRAMSAERSEGLLGAGYRGDDPCNHYYMGDVEDCQNVPSSQWGAPHFWASHTWKIDCPTGYGPVPLVPPIWNPAYGILANQDNYTSASGPRQNDATVTVTDDNARGHPAYYRAFLACCKPVPNDDESCDAF